MKISKLITIMIDYYKDLRLTEHAIKVYGYANGIGGEEGLTTEELETLCIAGILHDIGIPNAVKFHGSGKGEFQEKEGALLVPELMKQAGYSGKIIDDVSFLVGNHHKEELASSDILLQMLMEADYLVNIAEGYHPEYNIKDIHDNFFKTNTGIKYIEDLFLLKM